MLSVGKGTIDDYTIMTAGNIQTFPKRTSQSAWMECDSSVTNSGSEFGVSGHIIIDGEDNESPRTAFTMTFSSSNAHKLAFKAEAKEAYPPTKEIDSNYFSMTYHSPVDEEIYGMGLQYTEWDFKGKQVPLISEEAGVGRGVQPITAMGNRFAGGQGGNSTTSYAPAAQYITNKQRGFVFDQRETGIAYFDGNQTTEMLYWHATEISGTILWGEDPMTLAQELSKHVGTMRPLPAWAL